MGKLCISVEVLPKVIAEAKPAGFGRSQPNTNPTLPPPQGRIKWSMVWNPCYVLQECCGPKIFRQMVCICVGLLITAIAVAILPFIDSILSLVEKINLLTPGFPLSQVILIAIAVLTSGFTAVCIRKLGCPCERCCSCCSFTRKLCTCAFSCCRCAACASCASVEAEDEDSDEDSDEDV